MITFCFILLLTGCGKDEDPNYYYSKLNDTQKLLYDAYLEQHEHTNEEGYKTTVIIPSEDCNIYYNDETFIEYCLYYDHPEYYQHENNLDWTIRSKGKLTEEGYEVTLSQEVPLPDFEKEQQQLEEAANKYLAGINMKDTEYNIALNIHDKIIEDYKYIDYEDFDVNNIRYSQTVYGFLVGKDGEKHATCESVSDTYIYLLKKAGIRCAPVFGGVGTDDNYEDAYNYACSNAGRHEWIIAYLDGKWYEIDPTWDRFNEDKYSEPYRAAMKEDETYLNDRHHLFFAKTTEEMKFIKRNYFNYDGKNYSYDKSYIVHVRASNEDWYGQKSESCHERFIRASELTTEAK